MLNALSLEEKIGQLFVVGFDGLHAPGYILDWLAQGRIGGIIFFARNIASPQQLTALTQSLHQAAKHPLMIAVDQEGGAVARLRQGFTESPGAMALGAADSETLAEEVSEMLAHELRAVGINWNLAPVVDMTHDIGNPSVGTRSLGSDPERVGRLAAAQIAGFQKAGVAASAKHFPGLGNTPVDTHHALAVIDAPVSYLWENDLIPFRRVVQAGVASVMMTHVQFTQLDPQYPSTMSRHVITGLLREQIGFNGVICTDCMEMNAITLHYSPSESAVRATQGGADMILFSHTAERQSAAYEGLLNAAQRGEIPLDQIDQAVARIAALKARFAISDGANPSVIRQPSHLAISQKAARASIALLKSAPEALPLPESHLGLVEFSPDPDSIAMDAAGLICLADLLPGVQRVLLHPQKIEETALQAALQTARACQTLIVATRNAHLNDAQRQAAQHLLAQNKQHILLCLRNPFDAEVLRDAQTVLCSFGDSAPSLQAVVDALFGRFTPSGQSPVPLTLS